MDEERKKKERQSVALYDGWQKMDKQRKKERQTQMHKYGKY